MRKTVELQKTNTLHERLQFIGQRIILEYHDGVLEMICCIFYTIPILSVEFFKTENSDYMYITNSF